MEGVLTEFTDSNIILETITLESQKKESYCRMNAFHKVCHSAIVTLPEN